MEVTTDGLTFVCDDPIEVYRAQTLLTKEAGTIAWLRETVRPGDIVYDVGANIGIYTLYAARLVGADGRVYAFEPHVANAAHLLRNVSRNGFADRVTVLTVALHSDSGFQVFGYRSLRHGSSGSQYGHTRGEDGAIFAPVVSVLQYATSLDALVAASVLPAPQVLKLDVDGNELAVLRGMRALCQLGSLRSLQVETHQIDREVITRRLAEVGYRPVGQHHTAHGLERLSCGDDPASITDNTVYGKV